jgi:undecaprenyl-diphosphatase
MESLNITFFKALNAGGGLSGLRLFIPLFLADYLIWLVPLVLLLLWFFDRTDGGRTRLLLAFAAAMLALGINQLIGLVYFHPRPFMAGIGYTFLRHAADSSFPSDHATVFSAVGLFLVLDRPTRRAGLLLLVASLPVAWARVYLGVHFPFDMIGAFGTAALSVAAVRFGARPMEERVCRPLLRLYGRVTPG